MRILLIDDTRDETSSNIKRRLDLIARNYWTGVDSLVKMGPWDLLLLDHDLSSYEQDTGKEYTGYSIMCFLEKNPEYLPKKIEVVSSNPVGRVRMQTVIDQLYKNKEV